MEWTTLAATAIGAVLGIVATVAADFLRSRRDDSREMRGVRRQAYAEYGAALTRTLEDLYAIASGYSPDGLDRRTAARETLRNRDLYAARAQLTIVGKNDVLKEADAAYHALRDLRDVVAAGAIVDTGDFAGPLRIYGDAVRRVRDAMRADLGNDPVGFHMSG